MTLIVSPWTSPVTAILMPSSAQPYQPTSEELSGIRAKLADLTHRLGAPGAQPAPALLADVEVYRKAGEWILRYPEEFYTEA